MILMVLHRVLARQTYHGKGATLDSEQREYLVRAILGESDVDHDCRITFDEFIPW